jgi:hypothetical protein
MTTNAKIRQVALDLYGAKANWDGGPVGCHFSDACAQYLDELIEHILSTINDDDDKPVTEELLMKMSGGVIGPHGYEIPIQTSEWCWTRLTFDLKAGRVGLIQGVTDSGGTGGVGLTVNPKTCGELRRLCIALGIEAKAAS